MEAQAEKQTIYEFAFVLKVGESADALATLLKENGAEIVTVGQVSQVQLAYTVGKATAGLFGYYRIKFKDSDKLPELTKILELKENLLRFLFVKVPKEKPRPVRELKSATTKLTEKPAKGGAATADRSATTGVTQLDSLSNEKLEQTLEEILK